MEDTAACARSLPWTKIPKAMRAQPIPSGPKLKPNLLPGALALINKYALLLSKNSLIGVAPTKQLSRVEVQDWIKVNLWSQR